MALDANNGRYRKHYVPGHSCRECGRELLPGKVVVTHSTSPSNPGLYCVLWSDNGQETPGCRWPEDDEKQGEARAAMGGLSPRPASQVASMASVSPSSDPLTMAIVNAVEPILADRLRATVDEDRVLELVEQALNQVAPVQRIEIKQWGGSTTKLEGHNHESMPDLLRIMGNRTAKGTHRNIWLYGPAGTGKSTAARKCAEALGIPFYYVSLNPQSSPTRVEGYQTPHGEYVQTLFRRAYETGGVFLADEADNASPNLWTSLNNAIDSELGSFPDGMVSRHPDFVFVAAANTNGRGDKVYRDRRPQDFATLSRFVFLYWGYDAALEAKVCKLENPNAEPWLRWCHMARGWAELHNPDIWKDLHSRAIYDGAGLLRDGFPVRQVLDCVVLKGAYDSTATNSLLSACPLPTAKMEYAQ